MVMLIFILAIYGLAFIIKESSGPWGSMSWIRNTLIKNKYMGTFVYQLLDCWMCTGAWAGVIVYFLSQEHYKWNVMLLWGFAGGAICLMVDAALSRLRVN